METNAGRSIGGGVELRLLAAMSAAVLAVDSEGKVNFWSAGVVELIGKSPQEMLGKKV